MDAPRSASGRLDIPRPRRVVTAPVSVSPPSQRSTTPSSPFSSSPSSQAAPSGPEDLVETLYTHPSVRIISFTSSRHGFTTFAPMLSNNDVVPGSLPPSSQLERTIAVGAFCIYRAPGSVAFLSCGSALQPILPKSQCWCLDEDNSRFVLQIRRPQYWRIEVPVADRDDALRAEVLRDVFDKILLFEKTECPFQRSFTVQLPDPPETPVKKKAWTAEGKNLISSPFESDLSPPAHAPKAISRGRRATSIPHKFSLDNFESAINHEILEEQVERDDRSLGGTNQPTGKVVSIVEMHESRDALSRISSVVSRTLPSRDGNRPVETSDPMAANLPTPLANVAGEQTDVSIPGTPFAGIEASRRPESRTRDAGLDEIEVLDEGLSSYSIGPSCLGPPGNRAAVETDNETHQPRNFYGRENTHAPISWKEVGHKTGCHDAEGVREFVVLSDNTTTSPRAEIAETRGGYSLSDQRNIDALESDHSSSEGNPASFEGSGGVAPINLARKRMTRVLAGRSYTAPPQLTLVTSPPSKSNKQGAADSKMLPPQPQRSLAGIRSPSASTDSFHSVQSWHSSVASPPASPRTGDFSSKTESVESPESLSQANYSSDHTATPKNTINVVPSPLVVSDSCGSAEPTPRPAQFTIDNKQSEESIDDGSESRASRLSTFEDKLRTRRRSHTGNLSIRRRALSPLPPAANLFSPPRRQASRSPLAAIRRLPTAIIQKTIEILLSPPSHLIRLILKVAAKIVAGEWRGLVYGFSEAGEQIPVQWDYYSDGEFSDLSDDDDYTLAAHGSNYGNSIPRTDVRRRTRYTHDGNHDSCEVD
ncbi:inheritance of peroxisomes protein 1-domain-containing protein [Nemania abortiva]|nr:inheritance of peroxisomes protein 1-domain-containing protein [Nemania abortiva]